MNIEIQRPVAHCGSAMAAWLDPDGSLQRAGLLVVPMTEVEKLRAYAALKVDRILLIGAGRFLRKGREKP